MKGSVIILFAALAVHLSARDGRADYIEWSYSWQALPALVASDENPQRSLRVTAEAGPIVVSGSSIVAAANLHALSTDGDSGPSAFTDRPLTLRLTLSDLDSGLSAWHDFRALVGGVLSAGSADLDLRIPAPVWEETLGQSAFAVSLVDAGGRAYYAPPGPPDAQLDGAVSASVTVSGIDVQKAPEPSTLVLAGLALPVLGLRCRRGWRLPRR
jgi:hypothetical protein